MIVLTPLQLIFYCFATLAVVSALLVVTLRNTVYSALALVVTFFAMAAVWLILHAEFLALILILVYVGAVMTLFLFVVMMLNLDKDPYQNRFVRFLPLSLLILVGLVALLLIAVMPSNVSFIQMPVNTVANLSNTQQLAALLYTEYAYPFEIAGALLLTAIIAAITLAHTKPKRKAQNVDQQLTADPKERLKIIKMAPELKEESKA